MMGRIQLVNVVIIGFLDLAELVGHPIRVSFVDGSEGGGILGIGEGEAGGLVHGGDPDALSQPSRPLAVCLDVARDEGGKKVMASLGGMRRVEDAARWSAICNEGREKATTSHGGVRCTEDVTRWSATVGACQSPLPGGAGCVLDGGPGRGIVGGNEVQGGRGELLEMGRVMDGRSAIRCDRESALVNFQDLFGTRKLGSNAGMTGFSFKPLGVRLLLPRY
ncbi:hypothetical protein VNO80_13055 [Phaseolus coccineus]|uniref:Uncharacterized protein n=1 Tax=Phaseolus coccineus TaxID=3886 RepID=A0AAN9N5N9_PHACN